MSTTMAWQLSCLLLTLLYPISANANPAAKVPAVFVFGDSTADVGNNNYLSGTEAKADYAHYGIDFPHSPTPTGRFSNGYNGVDALAIHMGFTMSPPPYLSLANKTMLGLRGVNFASGGSGILDSTGDTIAMSKQIEYFKEFKSKVAARINTRSLESVLPKSVFIISSGGNDLFDFFSKNTSPKQATVEEFIRTISSNYMDYIKVLYGLGARKVALIDVPPLGCLPYARALNPTGECIESLNQLALGFNMAVKGSMIALTKILPEMKYSIGSTYQVVSDLVANPNANNVVNVACCGAGTLNAQNRCNPKTTYCVDRGNYLFWDMLHPSHSTAVRSGIAFYNGSLQFASPINVKQLVENN